MTSGASAPIFFGLFDFAVGRAARDASHLVVVTR